VKKTGKKEKVKVKKAAVRKPVAKVARTKVDTVVETRQPEAQETVADVVTTGAHLDAPSAVPHPGAGHKSVVRSEVKS
jgi:hypothetical protein